LIFIGCYEEWTMTKPAALLILPSKMGDKTDSIEETAPLMMQCLEDLRLAESVERALCATGRRPLRSVEITVHARLVTLGGRVRNFHLKQVAQAAAQGVAGIRQVRNNIEVVGQS
jgi:osmotically-inducible protein OsmY